MISISFSEGLSGIGSSASSIISIFAYLEILFVYSLIPSCKYFSLIFPKTNYFYIHKLPPSKIQGRLKMSPLIILNFLESYLVTHKFV